MRMIKNKSLHFFQKYDFKAEKRLSKFSAKNFFCNNILLFFLFKVNIFVLKIWFIIVFYLI